MTAENVTGGLECDPEMPCATVKVALGRVGRQRGLCCDKCNYGDTESRRLGV